MLHDLCFALYVLFYLIAAGPRGTKCCQIFWQVCCVSVCCMCLSACACITNLSCYVMTCLLLPFFKMSFLCVSVCVSACAYLSVCRCSTHAYNVVHKPTIWLSMHVCLSVYVSSACVCVSSVYGRQARCMDRERAGRERRESVYARAFVCLCM